MQASRRAGLVVALATIAWAPASFAQPAASASAGAEALAGEQASTSAAVAPDAGVGVEPAALPSASAAAPPPAAPSSTPVASASGPAASGAASAAPSASASGGDLPAARPIEPGTSAAVRLSEAKVFSILLPRGGKSAEERATAATAALRRALDDGATDIHVEQRGESVAVIVAGTRPILELGPDDATAAGSASLTGYANGLAAATREAIERDQSRSAAVVTMLEIALVILCAFLGLFLVRKLGQLADRARDWITQHPERVPAIRLQSIEVIRPASLRQALTIGLGAGKALAQIGVVYGWVLITLSLFEPTRKYAERLTGFVFGPLYALLARVVGSLPLLVVAAIAVIVVIVMVRFVALFFEGVTRGETKLDWLPADLAGPTSLLVRAALVLLLLVIAAPLMGGDDGGAVSRAGTVALFALGMAATPLLASIWVGVIVVYARRVRIGEHAEVGGRAGKVTGITLLEVLLEGEDGCQIRVPHLISLFHPTRVSGPAPAVSVEIVLEGWTATEADIRELLRDAASEAGERPSVELLAFDADLARYRVTTCSSLPGARSRLNTILAQTLAEANVPLGRTSTRARAPQSAPTARAR